MLLVAYRHGSVDINANSDISVYDADAYTYNVVAPYPLAELQNEAKLYLRHAALLHLAFSKRRPDVITKTHSVNAAINGVDLIPKDLSLTATYLIRDPRDVVSSYARHTGTSVDQAIVTLASDDTIMHRKSYGIPTWTAGWSTNVRSWTCKPDVVQIRYEDMLKDTATAFRKLLSQLRITVDEERVSNAVEQCKLERLKQQEDRSGFIENAKQQKFFGQGKGWKNELTDKQARRIEEDHGEVMSEHGYKLEYL
jgi:hypothetical protein